jgi:putative hemolysin
MYKLRGVLLLACLLPMVLVLISCQPTGSAGESDLSNEDLEEVEEPIADMANPAAVYCEGLGYKTEPRETAEGTDAACVFPEDSECGQWDFLSGRCGQEFTYCLQQGGVRVEVAANIGTCIFEDGSTCDEYIFFKGECQAGQNPAEGAEVETEPEPTDPTANVDTIAVIGWMGYVSSTTNGDQFDDFVTILPEGEVGDFGIEGADEAIEAAIIAMRDQEQAGKYANFWGTLSCDVIDYGGCQLLVTRIRSGMETTNPEPVED